MARESGTTTKIVTVANQKGGVGKTTTAVNLAAGLAHQKQSVLLVDCDAQGNASSSLGIRAESGEAQLYQLLRGSASPAEVIRSTAQPGLDLISSDPDLVGVERELAALPQKEGVLRKVLQSLTAYDFIILDCPPSLGLITVNALAAADSVLIPLQAEYFALEGLSQLVHTIRVIKHNFNPRLYIEGLLLTMYDNRIRLGFQVAREVRSHFGDLVYQVTIPRNVRLSESPSHGKSIFDYDPHSKGAESYQALTREFLDRQGRIS